MTKKKIHIKPTETFRNREEEIDAWVLNNNDVKLKSFDLDLGRGDNDLESHNPNFIKIKTETIDEVSRFTIVIPKYLHKRIKKHCAVSDINMKQAITEILSEAFPET